MHTTILREVGGSVMLAIPPVLLKLLRLEVGATVAITVEDGRLIVKPQLKPCYTLDELVAASAYSWAQLMEEREWVDAPAVGASWCEAKIPLSGLKSSCEPAANDSWTGRSASTPASTRRRPTSIGTGKAGPRMSGWTRRRS